MQRSLIQRLWLRTLRLLGLKRLSWNAHFAAGVSCYGERSPNTVRLVHALCGGGRLLEFGCGEGELPFVLPPGTFSSYMGYDISTVAIERARQRAAAAALGNVSFASCDIARWDGADSASLIVAEECLNYLSPAVLEQFLLRCGRCLTSGGAILAIVHSATKHARTLAVCRRVCLVRDEETVGERVYLTLVPRPADPVTRP